VSGQDAQAHYRQLHGLDDNTTATVLPLLEHPVGIRWEDFEQLVDLILARTGWIRISKLGGTREGIDIEVENLAANEIAFVQVKSSAAQAVLDDYIRRFETQRERYARMIFAVHSPKSRLTYPAHLPVQLWTCEKLPLLAVRLGLGEWVENKLSARRPACP
jgi:hypothetical protein